MKKEHSDSIVIREIYNRALSDGKAYENLRYLCKEIGARVTGSSEAQMAIEWGQKKLADYDINVSLQEITVPHWERGTKEAFWIQIREWRNNQNKWTGTRRVYRYKWNIERRANRIQHIGRPKGNTCGQN